LALSSVDRWVGPGWALAGDAAHTVHPLAGQGLNLGLGDAACLSQVLAGREYWRSLGDEKLLRRYERARKADVAAVSAVTDGLHGLFSQAGTAWQSARNWGMKSVSSSQPLKNWLMKRAAGTLP
jgi:2-polyprenyl-6-methoxyphenol hydroxylase-like FAD-dependent oxidoreductase